MFEWYQPRLTLKDHGLTAQEGILLHLLENERYREDPVCPPAVTQPGISQILGTDRSYISFVLSRMRENKLIDIKLCQVEGSKRKKKVYFLNGPGRDAAEDLRDHILPMEIGFRFRGQDLRGTFGEMTETTGMELVSLLKLTMPGQAVDIENELKRSLLKESESGSPDLPALPENFVGRGDELDIICRWVKGTHPLLCIRGLAGSGKTSLMAKAAKECRKLSTDLIYVQATSWGGDNAMISSLRRELGAIGRESLERLFKEKGTLTLVELDQALEMEMKKAPLMIFLDDVQNLTIDGRPDDLLSLLLGLLKRGLRLVIASREGIVIDPRVMVSNGQFPVIELTGLNRDEVQEYLKISGRTFREDLYEISSGNPMYLNLLVNFPAEEGLEGARRTFRGFLRSEVLNDLNRTERDILDLLSLVRGPFSRHRLFDIDAGDLLISESGLSSLMDGGLVSGKESSFQVHQLVRDVTTDMMNRNRRDIIHHILSDHYRERLEVDRFPPHDLEERVVNIRELLHHTWNNASLGERISALSEFGEEMMMRSMNRELELYSGSSIDELSRSREAEGLDRKMVATIIIFNGWCLSVKGDWDRAMEQYTSALEVSRDIDDEDLIGRCENAMGTIHLRKGELQRAFELISDSIKRMENKRDLCKARSNLSVVLWMKGELEEAIKEVDSSLDLALFLNDPMGVSRGLINKGIIQAQMKDLEGSRSSYEKAMKICQQEEFIHTLSIVHDNLGEVLREMGDNKGSMEHFRESLELAEKLGFKWQISEAKRNMASLMEKGPERTGTFIESIELFRSIGDLAEVKKTEEMMKSTQYK